MSTTKTIILESFKKDMYLHWNFSKQTDRGMTIKLYDDSKVYANKHAASGSGAIVSFGDDGAAMTGSDGSLKCDIIYDISGLNVKYWMDGKPFYDPNHQGKQVAFVNIINGEDSTDDDYNDFNVCITGWVHK